MPIYVNPGLKKKLSPALLGLLRGKTCFHVKAVTPELREGIEAALKLGTADYRAKHWL